MSHANPGHDAADQGDADGSAGPESADALRAEFDELTDRYRRSLADFQNFQRRSLVNEREARAQGVRSVVTALVGVLDHFDLALGQDASRATAGQILEGVRVIRAEFARLLAGQGVGVVDPRPGDEFDPACHEAVLRQPAPGVAPGHVSACLQPGYTLDERLVRPAKVAVAP